jgi:hypothetical protein
MEQTNRGFLFAMHVLLETSIEITLMFERRGEYASAVGTLGIRKQATEHLAQALR